MMLSSFGVIDVLPPSPFRNLVANFLAKLIYLPKIVVLAFATGFLTSLMTILLLPFIALQLKLPRA